MADILAKIETYKREEIAAAKRALSFAAVEAAAKAMPAPRGFIRALEQKHARGSHALIPEIKKWIPSDIDVSILSDRTGTIRASVADMQLTLLGTIGMVMLVVFVFLGGAAGIANVWRLMAPKR